MAYLVLLARKAVFELARKKQPAVVFFDEIDALLSTRKVGLHVCIAKDACLCPDCEHLFFLRTGE